MSISIANINYDAIDYIDLWCIVNIHCYNFNYSQILWKYMPLNYEHTLFYPKEDWINKQINNEHVQNKSIKEKNRLICDMMNFICNFERLILHINEGGKFKQSHVIPGSSGYTKEGNHFTTYKSGSEWKMLLQQQV